MRLRILLSTGSDEDLTTEDPCEIVTVTTEPLNDQTGAYVVTAFLPSGEQRDATTFLGNAAGYSPRRLAHLALAHLVLGEVLQGQGKETGRRKET